MLSIDSASISGVSRIDGKDVAYFSASLTFGEGENYSITKSAANKELYLANQEQCSADYEEFEKAAAQYIARPSDNE